VRLPRDRLVAYEAADDWPEELRGTLRLNHRQLRWHLMRDPL